jgi:hypothetical protein
MCSENFLEMDSYFRCLVHLPTMDGPEVVQMSVNIYTTNNLT